LFETLGDGRYNNSEESDFMTVRKKTWQEKLADNKGLPKVIPIEGRMSKRWGQGTVVVPTPLEVDELMRKVPKGKLTTINEIRSALAQKHSATIGCPVTTGIFAWIASHAAQEQADAGKKRIMLWWRTLKADGLLNEKYPGGAARQKALLEQEGHVIIRKGKQYRIQALDKVVIRPK
jgi:alkylated DNA nucleotide flippase Atl1